MNHNWWQLEGVQHKHRIIAVMAMQDSSLARGTIAVEKFCWVCIENFKSIQTCSFIACFLINVWRACLVLGLWHMFIFWPTSPHELLILEGKTRWVLLDALARSTVIIFDTCLSHSHHINQQDSSMLPPQDLLTLFISHHPYRFHSTLSQYRLASELLLPPWPCTPNRLPRVIFLKFLRFLYGSQLLLAKGFDIKVPQSYLRGSVV